MRARLDPLFAALVLLAGLLIGFALSTLAYRFRWLHVPQGGLVERMDRALKLTPAQHEQVVDVMEETRLKMEQMRHDFQRQRRQLLGQASERIRAVLTPEQQQEFDRSFILGEMGHHPR